MGKTLIQLSHKKLEGKPVFPSRFCVEICEKVHTHYKNLRILNTVPDWVSMAEGFRDALERWKKRGCPGAREGQHIELCRKKIYSEAENEDLRINLNDNLYKYNNERIFAEGADFYEPKYIHLKIRDIRVELSFNEFRELCDAIKEASEQLKESDFNPNV